MDNKNLPDLAVVKGLLATTLGAILVLAAYKIILQAIFFVTGIFLVYYGLSMLNVPAINHFFGSIKSHFNKFMS
jgi:hypothetical protein